MLKPLTLILVTVLLLAALPLAVNAQTEYMTVDAGNWYGGVEYTQNVTDGGVFYGNCTEWTYYPDRVNYLQVNIVNVSDWDDTYLNWEGLNYSLTLAPIAHPLNLTVSHEFYIYNTNYTDLAVNATAAVYLLPYPNATSGIYNLTLYRQISNSWVKLSCLNVTLADPYHKNPANFLVIAAVAVGAGAASVIVLYAAIKKVTLKGGGGNKSAVPIKVKN